MKDKCARKHVCGHFCSMKGNYAQITMPSFSFCLLPKREVIIKVNKWGQRSSSAKRTQNVLNLLALTFETHLL